MNKGGGGGDVFVVDELKVCVDEIFYRFRVVKGKKMFLFKVRCSYEFVVGFKTVKLNGFKRSFELCSSVSWICFRFF